MEWCWKSNSSGADITSHVRDCQSWGLQGTRLECADPKIIACNTLSYFFSSLPHSLCNSSSGMQELYIGMLACSGKTWTETSYSN